MKLIYKAGDINEANIVAGMLQAYGIEAHVAGYYLQGGVGDLAAMDFANVHVADEDVERAMLCIAEYEASRKPVTKGGPTRGNSRFIGVLLFVTVLVLVLLLVSYLTSV